VRIFLKFAIAAAVALWSLPSTQAQQTVDPSPLTLQRAVKIALEKNPLRKAALADTKVSSADVREARSVLMPRVTFSETATRGNDPVYVFGSRLRQQGFTADDFSLNKLNTPLPFPERE
jgi:outer membrane protein